MTAEQHRYVEVVEKIALSSEFKVLLKATSSPWPWLMELQVPSSESPYFAQVLSGISNLMIIESPITLQSALCWIVTGVRSGNWKPERTVPRISGVRSPSQECVLGLSGLITSGPVMTIKGSSNFYIRRRCSTPGRKESELFLRVSGYGAPTLLELDSLTIGASMLPLSFQKFSSGSYCWCALFVA